MKTPSDNSVKFADMDLVGDFLISNISKKEKKTFIEAEVKDSIIRTEKVKEKESNNNDFGLFSFRSTEKRVTSSSTKKLPRT